MKALIFVAAVIYCISPVDLFPGPIDDAIVCLVTTMIMRYTDNLNNGNR